MFEFLCQKGQHQECHSTNRFAHPLALICDIVHENGVNTLCSETSEVVAVSKSVALIQEVEFRIGMSFLSLSSLSDKITQFAFRFGIYLLNLQYCCDPKT